MARYLELAKQAEARIHNRAGLGAPLRAGTPGFAQAVMRLVGMPLTEFARKGDPLEVRVPWLDATLWFVPTPADAETMVVQGVSRGRIWTAQELAQLLSIPRLTTAQVQTVARAKIQFDGEVVEILDRPAATHQSPN